MQIAAPGEVGFSVSRLSRVGTWMQSYVEQNKLAGLIALVARRGRVIYFERAGLMDVEAAKPMQFDTIFRIYSMTKPVTTVALMMLYEEGRFQLYDPVSRFIPEFADVKVLAGGTEREFEQAEPKRAITIRDLLTHTAGLGYGFDQDSPIEEMHREAGMFGGPLSTLQIPLREMVRILVKLPLIYQPGTEWRYSVATDVLGYLIEVISGMSLDAFFEERVFGPLGMEDTGFYVPEAKLGRFAAMYGPAENGGVELLDAPATSPFAKPALGLSGGAGLVSTASDYARFCQMLLNGGALDGVRLLGRKAVELMRTNHLPDELIPIQVRPHILHGCGFGLGFRVLVNVAQAGRLGSEGEFGWGGLASTSFFIDPEEQLIGLLLTQLAPSRYYPVRNEFKVLVYQALVG
jgi:CubicO group peptidase (beta-lactamase class C family)